MHRQTTNRWLGLLGIELSPVSHTERIVSGLGGFLGIFAVLQISVHFVGVQAATLIVASMGASAVLLFAVPHGPLSQPWPVLGGHFLSGIIGVTCAILVPDRVVGAALAVAVAIAVMHYLHCIHPPGGATALSAVVGGPAVHALGYQFVLTPVLLNALVIFTVAVVFNYPFAWRRYPAYLKRLGAKKAEPSTPTIAHEDLVFALSEVDSFIDVSEQDLLAIYEAATRRSHEAHLPTGGLELGHYYSNGKYGADWSVRQIVDESSADNSPHATIIFKVLAGAGRRSSGVSTRAEFARWAKHEVYRDDENWRRVETGNE
jgi:CBS domain-containing membrane protein